MTKKTGKPDDLRNRAEERVRMPDPVKTLSPDEVQQALHELQVHQVELEMQNEELRRTQEDLEASRERYFDLYDLAPVGYFTLSQEGLILEANLRVAELLGVKRSALITLPFSRFILPEDQDVYYRHRKELFARGGTQGCELRLIHNDGVQFWARLESTVEDSDGNSLRRTVMSDITERKAVDDAQLFLLQCGYVKSGEDFFASLARYLAGRLGMDFVCIDRLVGDGLAARTVAVYFDGNFEDNVEYALKDTPCGDVVGKAICSFPESVRHLFPRDQVLQDMVAESYAGTTLWSSRGQPIGLIAVIGRKRMENPRLVESVLRLVALSAAGELERREAQEMTEHLASFPQFNPNPVMEVDAAGEVIFFNPATQKILESLGMDGREGNALLPVDFTEMLRDWDRKSPSTLYREVIVSDRVFAETVQFLPQFNVARIYAREITERKRAEDALKTAHEELEQRVQERTADLKEAHDRLKSETAKRERMEERIRQSEKMEAIGTLAGGIAHDFNNMLAAVIGFTEMAIDDSTPDNKAVDRALKQVLKAAFRGRDLVKQILAFSRKTHQEIIPLKLTPLVKETVKLLKATLPSTVEIEVRTKTTSDTVLADPSQMQQVVMNLCTNAGFAMREKGGKLTITMRDVSGSRSSLPADLTPGSYVLLRMSDTGTGMEPDILKRIFEPFFTTKEPGQGTGMGLAVVYGIIKSLHGDITVESQPGEGTTFNVFIPQAEPVVQPDEAAQGQIPHGTERILFVDDEEPLVEAGRSTLRRLGYKVVGATDSLDALSLFLDNPGRFDVVIADHTMPMMSGLDLAKELVKVRPDIPIILCTGYSDNVSPEIAKEAGIREFLMKPLTRRELAEALRRALDAKPER